MTTSNIIFESLNFFLTQLYNDKDWVVYLLIYLFFSLSFFLFYVHVNNGFESSFRR